MNIFTKNALFYEYLGVGMGWVDIPKPIPTRILGPEEEEEEGLEVVFLKSPTQQSNFNVYDFFICKLDYFTIN